MAMAGLDRYDDLFAHIVGHKYFLSLERNREVPFEVAAASWYDNVFVPVAHLVRRHNVVERMHRKATSVDAYVAVTRNWLEKGSGRELAQVAMNSLLEGLRPRTRRWIFA